MLILRWLLLFPKEELLHTWLSLVMLVLRVVHGQHHFLSGTNRQRRQLFSHVIVVPLVTDPSSAHRSNVLKPLILVKRVKWKWSPLDQVG